VHIHQQTHALYWSDDNKAIMKLIIFDCDGTLVDSEMLCHLALQHQLATLGLCYSADKLMVDYRGVKLNRTLASLEDKFSLTFPESFESEYRQRVSDLFDEQLQANAGVAELLSSLTIPYCIASSAPMKKIQHALKVTGLDKYFDNNIFSSYEIESWKPEPGVFLHAAKMMNVEPIDCCVVEDSVVGLQGANAAKMKSVYYAPDVATRNPLATVQIQHMSALLKAIT